MGGIFHETAIEPDPDNIHELYISGGGGGLPVYQDKNGDWWDHTTGTRMSSAPGDPVNAGKIIYGRDDMLLYTEHVVGKEGREFHWGKYMVTDSVYVPYASEESVTRVAISGEGIENSRWFYQFPLKKLLKKPLLQLIGQLYPKTKFAPILEPSKIAWKIPLRI